MGKAKGMAPVAVCVTAASVDEAKAIGRALVEARLVASVNIVPGVASLYWWEGALREGDEAMLWAKTRADLVAPLTARVKALHSYACPCVIALPITGGNPDYLAWIDAETALSPTDPDRA